MPTRSPPQYKRLQALREALGLETPHGETSPTRCMQQPVHIGAQDHAAVAEQQEFKEHDDVNQGAVDRSGESHNVMADDSEEDCGPGQAFPLLNEYSYLNGWKSSMKEQKQWSEDIEGTVDQIHRSLYGSGTKSGVTRGKGTRS
ncbi:hypothetical protein CBS147353_11463 [Aspergillus niger]|nr:hypothetical protein CBS147353_11463 [Aspergillus niger]